MTFNELNLSAPLLRAIAEAGYETPSPIQAKAIPPVLEGRDLMGCAQTGTGKTAAFALPMLDRLNAAKPRKPGAIRALILTPTRELALQIGESFAAYGKYQKLRATVIFGGVGQAPQVEAIKKGVEILIACPGRLNDLVGQGLVDLSNIEIFVLDEADRMLDMGFVHDVKKVIAKLPKVRQNLMFSATMPKEIEQLAAGILHDPAFVKVDPVSSTVERIDQILAKKLLAAAADTNAKTICLAGGVAANGRLRQLVNDGAQKLGAKVYLPELKYCGDNGAMIAAQGYYEFKDGNIADLTLNGLPTLAIDYR